MCFCQRSYPLVESLRDRCSRYRRTRNWFHFTCSFYDIFSVAWLGIIVDCRSEKIQFYMWASYGCNKLSVLYQCFGSAWERSRKPDESFDEAINISCRIAETSFYLS